MKTKRPKARKPRKPTLREEIELLKKDIEELKSRPTIKWIKPEPAENPFPWDETIWPKTPYSPENPWAPYIKD